MKNLAHLPKLSLGLFAAAALAATLPLAAGQMTTCNWDTWNPPVECPTQCKGHDITIWGTPGDDDPISGTSGNDVIHGGPGRDKIRGKGGNDVLCGGQDDDDLKGGTGEDKLYGGGGEDTLNGQEDSDCLQGDSADGFDGGDSLSEDYCVQPGANCENSVTDCKNDPWSGSPPPA